MLSISKDVEVLSFPEGRGASARVVDRGVCWRLLEQNSDPQRSLECWEVHSSTGNQVTPWCLKGKLNLEKRVAVAGKRKKRLLGSHVKCTKTKREILFSLCIVLSRTADCACQLAQLI